MQYMQTNANRTRKDHSNFRPKPLKWVGCLILRIPKVKLWNGPIHFLHFWNEHWDQYTQMSHEPVLEPLNDTISVWKSPTMLWCVSKYYPTNSKILSCRRRWHWASHLLLQLSNLVQWPPWPSDGHMHRRPQAVESDSSGQISCLLTSFPAQWSASNVTGCSTEVSVGILSSWQHHRLIGSKLWSPESFPSWGTLRICVQQPSAQTSQQVWRPKGVLQPRPKLLSWQRTCPRLI